MKIALIAGGEISPINKHYDYYVGIDRGSLFLLENQLPLDLAIGDFDSVSALEFVQIQQNAKQMIIAPAEKDDTDTELALKTVFTQFPNAFVTIYGAFGGRLDHLFSNVFLPSEPTLAPFMQQIALIDMQNEIRYVPAGTHKLQPIDGMKYVSFMADGDAELTISGAKYELNSQNFFKKKIYSSNEFIGNPIELSFSSGYVVIIQTRDKK